MLAPRLAFCLVVFAMAAQAQPDLAHVGEQFHFVINADPQMGPKDGKAGNERHLYALLAQFVEEVNARDEQPAFVLFNGDMVAFARPAYFDAFVEAAEPIKAPTFLVHGNHDGRHPDESFLGMQEALAGFRAWHYSFDAGDWHFVVIPGKEQLPTPESERALLDWLDADLAANANRPTMVFVHYHLLPVGLSQGEYYTLSMELRRALVERFTAAEQVRYVISGHVHCGIQSSIKTSWTCNGTHFLVSPSPVSPRNFGEEFDHVLPAGERDEGYYLDVHIDGDEARFVGRKIGSDVRHEYPANFQPFHPGADPRALTPTGALAATEALVNGGFDEGLDGWLAPHRYITEEEPGFVARIGQAERGPANDALWLFAREKGHAWAYDEYTERYQLVAVPEGSAPVLRARYHVPMEGKSAFGGGYIRATAYAQGEPRAWFFFHWGASEDRVRHLPQAILYSDYGEQKGLGLFQRLAEQGDILAWRVPDLFNRWSSLEAPLAQLYDVAHDEPGAFAKLGIDTLLVAPGVWTGMEPGNHGGAWYDDIALIFDDADAEPRVDGRPLETGDYVFDIPYGTWYLRGFDK